MAVFIVQLFFVPLESRQEGELIELVSSQGPNVVNVQGVEECVG